MNAQEASAIFSSEAHSAMMGRHQITEIHNFKESLANQAVAQARSMVKEIEKRQLDLSSRLVLNAAAAMGVLMTKHQLTELPALRDSISKQAVDHASSVIARFKTVEEEDAEIAANNGRPLVRAHA